MADWDSLVCTGAIKCRELKDVVHTIYYGGKEINQRPEYCSGRSPHRYNHEECSPHTCVFLKESVECKRIYVKVMDY